MQCFVMLRLIYFQCYYLLCYSSYTMRCNAMLCYAMECKASFTTLHAMIGDSNLFSVPCYVMRYRALQRHAPGAISDLNASISVYFHLLHLSRSIGRSTCQCLQATIAPGRVRLQSCALLLSSFPPSVRY